MVFGHLYQTSDFLSDWKIRNYFSPTEASGFLTYSWLSVSVPSSWELKGKYMSKQWFWPCVLKMVKLISKKKGMKTMVWRLAHGSQGSAVFLEWRRAESTKSSTNSWPERVHSASSNIYHFLIERKVFSVYVKGKAWSKKIISKFTEFLFTSLSKRKILPYDNSIKNTHITTFRRFVMVYLFFYSM